MVSLNTEEKKSCVLYGTDLKLDVSEVESTTFKRTIYRVHKQVNWCLDISKINVQRSRS